MGSRCYEGEKRKWRKVLTWGPGREGDMEEGGGINNIQGVYKGHRDLLF